MIGLTPMPASRAIIQTRFCATRPPRAKPSKSISRWPCDAARSRIPLRLLSRATVLPDLAAENIMRAALSTPPFAFRALVSLADRPQTKAFLEVRKTMIEVVR